MIEIKQTLGNQVCVKLDQKNDVIETPSGLRLIIDTSYEVEKHLTRLGEVIKAPTTLLQRRSEIPWKTDIEIQDGDRVVMYFLAIQNCLAKEQKKYFRYGNDIYIFIKYHNIYARVRDGVITPINGYILVEPVDDPSEVAEKERLDKLNLTIIDSDKASNVDVVYGKIAHIGKPNEFYNHPFRSDDHYDLKMDDIVVMKRIRDIPVEYELHAKLDSGRKLYRVQRHDILAKL
jgi:hypothetical protein